MTWTALTYAFGSKLTSTKMTQNQDNFTAMARGQSGAPIQSGVLLDDQTVARASPVSSVIINGKFSAAYDRYIWLLTDVEAPTANANVNLTVSTDGSTYSSSGYYQGAPNASMTGANASFTLSSAGLGMLGNTDYPMAGEIHLFHPLGTSYRKQFIWELNYYATTSVLVATYQHGTWATLSAYVAAKIDMGGSTFAGRFRLYGVGASTGTVP